MRRKGRGAEAEEEKQGPPLTYNNNPGRCIERERETEGKGQGNTERDGYLA